MKFLIEFDKKNKVFVIEHPIMKDGLPSLDVKKVSLRSVSQFLVRLSFVNRNEKWNFVIPKRLLIEEIAWRELRGEEKVNTASVYNITLLTNAFQGGTYREKYYFPKYYYPLKVLEGKNYLRVKNNTIITSEEKIKKARIWLRKLRGD